MTGRTTWKVDAVVRETEETVTFVFAPQGERFSYQPGQFINVQAVIEGEQVSRSYSFSSSPAVDAAPAITVKKVDGGKMSQYLFRRANQIKHLDIDGPYGSFLAGPGNQDGGAIVLLGGGSGITPLYSILKTLLASTAAMIYLIDCNRTWSEVVFAEPITRLETVYRDRLQVHHFLSREGSGVVLPCADYTAAKPSKLLLKKILKQWLGASVQDAAYFLCGPSGLLNMAQETLENLGVGATRIHTEYFTPPQDDPALIDLPDTNKEVLLHFYEQSNLLDVRPRQTILDTALEEKIPLDYSCKNGTCGKCAGKLTAGKVHMKQNFALTEESVKEGFILLCQSHPLDDAVSIEIG